jgi:hypothetical protein
MNNDHPALPDEAATANLCFYWSASPTVSYALLHNSVVTIHRYPEHLAPTLTDRAYFRCCHHETMTNSAAILLLILPCFQVDDAPYQPDRWIGNDWFMLSMKCSIHRFLRAIAFCLMKSYAAALFDDLIWQVVTQYQFTLMDRDVLRGLSPTHQVRSDVLIANRTALDDRFLVAKRPWWLLFLPLVYCNTIFSI